MLTTNTGTGIHRPALLLPVVQILLLFLVQSHHSSHFHVHVEALPLNRHQHQHDGILPCQWGKKRTTGSTFLPFSKTNPNQDEPLEEKDSEIQIKSKIRRTMILSTVPVTASSIVAVTTGNNPHPSQAVTTTTITNTHPPFPNIDCLLDLPPQSPNSVRIYLCRHGQTENNRLHLVQGARLDPPMNGVGEQMALRMGMVLNQLHVVPTIWAHSSLQRAKQTAMLAASCCVSPNNNANKMQQHLPTLPSLGEIDFGPQVEGKAVSPDILQTYAAWAVGSMDAHLPEGESAQQVLQRGAMALEELLQLARQYQCTSLVAVSHSMYLRMLLALVMDVPLVQVPRHLENGCINVLDLDGTYRIMGPKSMVLGGPALSQAPASFQLKIPTATVVRINEHRHLEGLLENQ